MSLRFRLVDEADIPRLMCIRNGVRENALVSTTLTSEDYRKAMFDDGCAWVCEIDGMVVGFANARDVHADIWALFVDEGFERRGVGTGLMDLAEAWIFERGIDTVRLRTAPGTRAERLYLERGWSRVGTSPQGEAVLELTRATFHGR